MTEALPRRSSGKDRTHRSAWNALWDHSSTWHRAAWAGILLVGAALRAYQATLAITEEEAAAFDRYVTLPLGELLTTAHVEAAHPLHAVLVKCSVKLFGIHLWSMRLPALLAGIACLPVFYSVVRTLFNRHIALVGMAILACEGGLVEVSALARGYSWTWLLMLLMLGLARAFVKGDRLRSAAGMAFLGAVGIRFAPVMAIPATAIFLWAMVQVITSYDSSVRRRLMKLGVGFVLFILFTVLLHLPALLVHGIDGLLNDPAYPDRSWSAYLSDQRAGSIDLWTWMVGPAGLVLSILFGICVLAAIYISVRYRALVVVVAACALLYSLLLRVVVPVEAWSFMVYFVHLGTAIALFQLAKVVGGRFFKTSTDRVRTAWVIVPLVVVMAPMGMQWVKHRVPRFGQAGRAAAWVREHLGPSDRLLVDAPWDTPVEFHLLAEGVGRGVLAPADPVKGRLFVLVGTAADQTLATVLERSPYRGMDPSRFVKVEDWPRLEIFATP